MSHHLHAEHDGGGHMTDNKPDSERVRELLAEVDRLQAAWLGYETIQPNGELRATVSDILAENEMLSRRLDAQRDALVAIRRIASRRIEATSSLDEAATLWEIVRAAEVGGMK